MLEVLLKRMFSKIQQKVSRCDILVIIRNRMHSTEQLDSKLVKL